MSRAYRPWIRARTWAACPAALIFLACGHEVESDLGSSGDGPQLALAAAPGVVPRAAAYTTHLYSERDADVYSRLDPDRSGPGLVVAIHAEIGQAVQAGAVLATLDDDEGRLQVRAAEAEAEQAASELARLEELRQRELVSEAEHETARYAARLAEVALDRAKLELARTRVRAPFAGVVSRRYVREGERVGPEQPLFRVTALSPLRARILVPEERAGEFRVGAPAAIAGPSGERATGRVLVVGPAVDPGSGAREVLIEIAEADGLLPGASVTIVPPVNPGR